MSGFSASGGAPYPLIGNPGVATPEEIASKTPSKERLARGAVAIIECFQKIPCNPCYHACPRKAIREFEDINDLPTLDFDRCNGCAICVSSCPGLAIFVVDEAYGATEALVSIPYELLPVPSTGDQVVALDREGKAIGTGRVVRVLKGKKQDRTLVVSVAVPKALSMVARNIAVRPAAGLPGVTDGESRAVAGD